MRLSESIKYIPLAIAFSLPACEKAPDLESLPCAEIRQRIAGVETSLNGCITNPLIQVASKNICYQAMKAELENLRKIATSKDCK